jgi:hypothetical protein
MITLCGASGINNAHNKEHSNAHSKEHSNAHREDVEINTCSTSCKFIPSVLILDRTIQFREQRL